MKLHVAINASQPYNSLWVVLTSQITVHRDVTLFSMKSSNELKLEERKLQMKLSYCFTRSSQLGNKNFYAIYTLSGT